MTPDLNIDQQQAIALASARMRMAGTSPVTGDAGPWHAAGEGLANAIPGGQKITSAIGAGIAKVAGVDDSFSDLYNKAQTNTAATAAANPKSAMAGTAAGIGTSLPIMGAVGKAIGAGVDAIPGGKAAAGYLAGAGTSAEDAGALSRAGNLGIRAAKGAAMAAPVGALYGAAAAPSDKMGEGALEGAGTASAMGAVLPVAGAALGVGADAVGAARDYLNKDTVSGQAARAADASAVPSANTVAMGKVIKRFNADFTDPAQRQAAIDAYLKNPDIGLAEAAGKNTKNLALGAAQYPSGEAAAQDYFQARTSSAPARIAKTFADQVSSNQDYFGTLDGITEKGRAAAGPLYDEAYSANKSVVSPAIDKILETPAGKQALGVARTKMLNDQSLMGIPDKELGEQMRDAVKMGDMADPNSRGVAAGLNMRSLDYVKRALDDQISAAYRAGENDNGRILTGLKNGLLKEMDDADVTKPNVNLFRKAGEPPPEPTGAYARARAVSGDYIRNSNAMDDGRNFMKPGTAGQPEEIAAKFKALGPTEQEAYKAGMVRAVKEAMDKPSADQPNFYTKVFGSPDLQNRIKAVLNPSEFEVLSKNMKAEADLYKFKNETLGNSRTAIKSISADEFTSGGQEIMKDLATGGSITRTATKAATQWIGSMFDGLSNKTAGQVSKILYETDPAKKLQILKAIQGDPGLAAPEKQEAVKAYFSVNGLFKNMAKQAAVVAPATGGNDAQ